MALLKEPSPFLTDEEKAERFKSSLRAQSGEESKLYEVFLKKLMEFNEENLEFQEIAAQGHGLENRKMERELSRLMKIEYH